MKKAYKIESAPKSAPIEIKIILGEKQYSEVKLFKATENKNGERVPSAKPGKRWYVYFYWRNPKTDRFDIKVTFTKGINRLKTVKHRKAAGNAIVKATELALSRGWIPDQVKNKIGDSDNYSKSKTIKEALQYAFEIKSREVKEATKDDYSVRLNFFFEWLKNNNLIGLSIEKVTIEHIYRYLDFLQLEYKQPSGKGLSNTSIDNYKRALSALFTVLQHKRIIPHNFVNDIPKTKSTPVKNKPFTVSQLSDIKEEIVKSDPYLINVLSLMIYPILRPREIVRLKVEDINTKDWILGVERKNHPLGYSRIIDKLKPVIKAMELEKYPGNYHLITKYDKPAIWETKKLSSKVTLLGKRFKKILVKLGYTDNYGLYSCRHTAILDLFNNLQKKGLNEQEIIIKLMPITGHKSQTGIRNYLREIQAFIPDDHSDIYSIDI
ncbi:tyrosine-type recombinase/integrase [Mesonia aquimarina]|uniref:tyrosine-type recombinase/integrase n=1 Tax=Mesonia aquimarina TaxID=1504967 RepID=UPI000EF599DE|nr:site-specific integrase [Mesonia aquimarina]